MKSTEDLTCREFIRWFRKTELEGFVDHYKGRQRALPEISPKRMPRDAWSRLLGEYLAQPDKGAKR
jgi:hypothetical protein